jgi:putative heme-binding domain-containing protein
VRNSWPGALADAVSELWPITRKAREQIQALRAVLTVDRLAQADDAQGRIHFQKTCAQCHKLFGEGESVGPELTGSQRNDLGYLLENILDPSATLADNYRVVVFVLNDGRVLNGIVVQQDARSVTIQTANDRVLVRPDEIEQSRTLDVSLMPEGLLDTLSEQQVIDLIRYLQSPHQVPLVR